MREHMLRSRESSISHGSDVQPCGSGHKGEGEWPRGQFVEVGCGGVCRDGGVYGGGPVGHARQPFVKQGAGSDSNEARQQKMSMPPCGNTFYSEIPIF